jgi:hypothetical protein
MCNISQHSKVYSSLSKLIFKINEMTLLILLSYIFHIAFSLPIFDFSSLSPDLSFIHKIKKKNPKHKAIFEDKFKERFTLHVTFSHLLSHTLSLVVGIDFFEELNSKRQV